MRITLYRFSDNGESTLGLMLINDRFNCFTLEDEKRAWKKYGETRIPAGRYQIKLRTEGRFHEKYSKRFEGMHKGMLHLQDVPGFEYILIHPGNDDDDTAGCILVGDIARNNVGRNGLINESTQAYIRFYNMVVKELVKGNKIYINILDENSFLNNN